ncbi:MAG: hypothetical protein N2556_03945 [Anaerolineae bacterium]|nr:hypothetical protein [Anaerolineae bacterium]
MGSVPSAAGRMPEVRIRLSPALYERLVERAAALQREPDEVAAEAVERWLEREDVETRLQRALERSGLLVPPEERQYAKGRPVHREELERRLAGLRLTPPLSEDIIAEREER